MKFSLANWIIGKFSHWLTKDGPPRHAYLCDFDRIKSEVRAGDVLLIEGRNRISRIIQQVTQSPWSHAALYIGRIHSINNPQTRAHILQFTQLPPETQLIVEAIIGQGTIVRALNHYAHDHIRICRPQGLAPIDAQKVIDFAVSHLGTKYSIRHVFDLARFLIPWSIYPPQWRSTLLSYSASKPTEEICSYLIAEAFASVKFPILPLIKKDKQHRFTLIQRNPRLFTPSDFDYSPYFSIIKYPIFPVAEHTHYRNLPWSKEKIISSDKAGIHAIGFTKEKMTPQKNQKKQDKDG